MLYKMHKLSNRFNDRWNNSTAIHRVVCKFDRKSCLQMAVGTYTNIHKYSPLSSVHHSNVCAFTLCIIKFLRTSKNGVQIVTIFEANCTLSHVITLKWDARIATILEFICWWLNFMNEIGSTAKRLTTFECLPCWPICNILIQPNKMCMFAKCKRSIINI